MNKPKWYVFAVLLVLATLFSMTLALATPVGVTVSFTNAPENLNGQTAYFYGSSGLVTSTSISNNATNVSLEPGIYVMKVTGSKTQTLLLINITAATSYTVNYASSSAIVLNITVNGVIMPVDYTVKVATLNQTMGSKYKGYIFGVSSATLSFPSQLLFPTIFGYQLKSITLDGTNVSNGFSVSTGQHNVVVQYEQAGIPLWVILAAVIVIIVIAVIAGRKGGKTVTFATMLNDNEWLERVNSDSK
ncbi:MAG: hypothetical protein JHC26_07400 [Thermofilum sp.]|jgi:uncharacterized membrane protein|uniref:hypothetical protein n=1 Tax=Thermofilum sp. TaxID=1961369 RepID=UPI00258F7CB6|nr:hypothetical protein [Thermofilum sp.]MCI4408902.1 hypothetical protein [Thermofilum sp.]